jgi:hypothetical protein
MAGYIQINSDNIPTPKNCVWREFSNVTQHLHAVKLPEDTMMEYNGEQCFYPCSDTLIFFYKTNLTTLDNNELQDCLDRCLYTPHDAIIQAEIDRREK